VQKFPIFSLLEAAPLVEKPKAPAQNRLANQD